MHHCRCSAGIASPSYYALSLLLGLLAAVGSLNASVMGRFVFLSWTAPFTLDISLNEIDITYCVDVVSSISLTTLHSQCGIKTIQFMYVLPPKSWCDRYTFTVTPVNLIGNGTRTRKNYFQSLPGIMIILT